MRLPLPFRSHAVPYLTAANTDYLNGVSPNGDYLFKLEPVLASSSDLNLKERSMMIPKGSIPNMIIIIRCRYENSCFVPAL